MCAHFFVNGAHVYPKSKAAVIVMRSGVRAGVEMQFGLIPSFERLEKPKMIFHNARVESIFEKPSFREAILQTRCLVPLESFYEYVWKNPKTMQVSETENFLARFFHSDKQSAPLMAAGIWNAWRSPSGEMTNTFAIITSEPNAFIAEVGHDRSPIFLKERYFDTWLDSSVSSRTVLSGILYDPQPVELGFEIELEDRKKMASVKPSKDPNQGSLF